MLDLYLLRPGEHDLEILPSVSRVRVGRTILRPAEDPRPPGVRRLVGGPGWRVRVGDYRVVHELEDAAREVNVVRVRDRWGVAR